MAGKFEIKAGASGKFSFVLKAGNGQVIMQSSDSYADAASAETAIGKIKAAVGTAGNFASKENDKGDFWFTLASAGDTLGKSEMYTTKAARDNGIESVTKNAPDAPVNVV